MNAGSILTRQRGRVMGFAALMIIVYHCFFEMQSAVAGFFAGTNNKMGVDLFVFLSGFGLVQSLSKDARFFPYYKRRLRRLLPSYYVIFACMLPFAGKSLKALLVSVIPVNVWFGDEDLWYVSASLGYYLLVPGFYHIFKKTRFPRIAMCLLAAVFALAVPPLFSFMHAEIALMRIPALAMGVAFGVCCTRGGTKADRIKDLFALGFMACCGIALYITRYNFGLLSGRELSYLAKNLCAPCYALIIAFVFELIDRTPVKIIGRAFDEIGKYSLEMYFEHLVIKVVALKFVSLPPIALLALLLITSYPAARVIYWCGRLILRIWERIFSGRKQAVKK